MVEILYHMGRGYGYEIYKAYKEIFPSATLRVMYYHLKKGVFLKEFKVQKVIKEEGDYSWGSTAEKVYYLLGENARPQLDKRVKDYFAARIEKQSQKKRALAQA